MALHKCLLTFQVLALNLVCRTLCHAAWIARQQAAGQAPCSPSTNQPLPSLQLAPVPKLRNIILGLRAAGQLS